MDPGTVWKPKGEYVVREIGGETILVPVRSGVAELDAVYTLNEVGSVIWTGVSEGRSFREIVEAVVASFEVPEESAARDSEEFLVALQERGLVEIAKG